MVWKLSSRPQYAEERVKRLCKNAEIEGQFTNHSLCATTPIQEQQKGIPGKFVMERTGHRDVRSLQKFKRLDTSSKVQISKKFDCCEVEEDKGEVKGC